MKKKSFFLIFSFFLLLSYEVQCQTNCTVPLPPVLVSVSVQPETGITEFTWTPSPSDEIAAYIVYTYKNGDGFPVDTVWDPSATSFSVPNAPTKYYSVSYVVTAHRLSKIQGLPGCTSPLSNVLSTIFCEAKTDTCHNRIRLTWNRYSDSPKRVKEYRILVSENNQPLTERFTVSRDSGEYSFTGFKTSVNYCFAVKAVFDDGKFSESNKSCLITWMQQAPAWINADYATTDNDKIHVSFSIDPQSDIRRFNLEKKAAGSPEFILAGQPVVSGDKVTFTDENPDVSGINFYRLSAINSCNVPVVYSDTVSNIALSLESEPAIKLKWNSPKPAGKFTYEIFSNTGNGFESAAVIDNDTSCVLNPEDFFYRMKGSVICFHVTSTETGNPHGINSSGNSEIKCISPDELITVPNVFTPNNDLLNDRFRPVLSFTPSDYHLVITDRNGRLLFETRDFHEEWDGSDKDGNRLQNVYLWFLRVTTTSGKKISKTGTVTIITGR
jgi:gliding motility-associated-like protein